MPGQNQQSESRRSCNPAGFPDLYCYNVLISTRADRFTYFSRVFGCQMNVADVDDISARLNAYGGRRVETPEEADLVMVNTCMVRKKAEDKAMSFFGGLKHTLNTQGRRPFIVAMGCVIPRNQKKISETYPHIDLLVNYSDPDLVLSQLMEHFELLSSAALDDEFSPAMTTSIGTQNFVTAIRGCNHRCSFCVVPWARGPQRDEPIAKIVEEAQAHELRGAPDVTILGQSIMAYGRSSGDGSQRFIEMMEAVLENTSFPWVRFLTSLACDMTDEICERIIAHPRITPLLHLPIQSGSDRVLTDMKRKHDVATYRRMVAKARAVRPDLYLTTDILVGFPTETEADYRETYALMEEIGFDDAFMFAYSERPGTHSARHFPDLLSREVKIRRLSEIIELQRKTSAERSLRYIGQELEIIIEAVNPDGAIGRTSFNKPVYMPKTDKAVGEYSRALIRGVRVSAFTGEEISVAHEAVPARV
ncbi:MAG: MiaB/RimO family radical SAM methylthiotransferase [bacterium]